MKSSAELIGRKHPILSEDNFYGFVDGFRLRTTTPEDNVEQEIRYNGAKKFHCVGAVMVMDPNGMIIYCSLNAPGSWHDSKICNRLYKRILNPRLTPPGYKIAGDQGFKDCGGQIYITKKVNGTPKERAVCTIRQAIEWGVNTLHTNWPRIGMEMNTDLRTSKEIVLLCVLLTNFRTKNERINQIYTYFHSP